MFARLFSVIVLKELSIVIPCVAVVMVFLALLGFSLQQVSGTNPENEEVAIFEKVPLSDSEIKARWPNLPTAEELWNSDGGKFFVDTRSFGKQVVDPQFADVAVVETEIEWEIMNYTADIPNFLRGGIMLDVPIIWLQYNDTVWIQVPINTLD